MADVRKPKELFKFCIQVPNPSFIYQNLEFVNIYQKYVYFTLEPMIPRPTTQVIEVRYQYFIKMGRSLVQVPPGT